MSIMPEHPDGLGDDLDRVVRILGDAEENNETLSAWEDEFCADMRERVEQYGKRTRVSEKQMAALDRVETKLNQ